MAMDALLQALMAGQGYDSERESLDQQLQQALALRNQPQLPAYGALGGGLSGLATALNGITSAVKERQIRGKQDALRQKFSTDNGNVMSQLSSLMAPPPPQAQPPPRQNPMLGPPSAMQAAVGAGPGIPIEQPAPPQVDRSAEMQRAGMLMQALGGNRWAGAGQALMGLGTHQQDTAAHAAAEKLKTARQDGIQRLMEAGRQRDDTRADSQFAETSRHNLETESAARASLGARVAAGGVPPADGSTPLPGTKAFKDMKAELARLDKAISESGSARGLIPQMQNRFNASERIETMAMNPDGSVKDLTPELMHMLATESAALVANGSPATAEIKAMAAKTGAGDVARFLEYMSGNPQPAHQKEFAKMLLDQSKAEKATIGKQMLRSQLKALSSFKPTLFDPYPDMAWNAVSGRGLKREMVDPATMAPLENYVGDAAPSGTAAAPTGGLSPEKKARLEELRRKHAEGTLK